MNAHGTAYTRIDAIVAKIKHLSFDANSRWRQVFYIIGDHWETRYAK
jgi:hypothetical protein